MPRRDEGVPVIRTLLTRAVVAVAIVTACPGVGWVPAIVHAQSETSDARDLFQNGVAAAREERWAEAVDLFQQSYELSARPITMMNLAGALAQLGRLAEAAEAYRSVLSMARTGSAARLRDDAEEQLRALEQRIPRVRIRVLGLTDTDVVRLDEWEVSHAALDLPVPVDPGTHEITVERSGASRSFPFTATEGVASEVVFDARPDAFATGPGPQVPALAVSTDPVAPPASRSIVEEPVFWIVIGAVVLGGAAIGLGVGLGTQSESGLYVGNVSPVGVPL